MKKKPVPTIDKYGFLSEYFMRCGKDGKIRVKDGRTLEEYLNDPRLVKRRKGRESDMVIIGRATYEFLLARGAA